MPIAIFDSIIEHNIISYYHPSLPLQTSLALPLPLSNNPRPMSGVHNPVIMYCKLTLFHIPTMTKSPQTLPPTNAQHSLHPAPYLDISPHPTNNHPLPLNFLSRQTKRISTPLSSFLPHVPNNFTPRSFFFHYSKRKRDEM